MAYLVLTAAAAQEALKLAGRSRCAVWINCDALSSEEVERARAEGLNISRFTYSIDSSDLESVADAVETIREHYPGEVIWVEGVCAS